MNDDSTSLEMRLLTLLHQAREEHDDSARGELNALLRENATARRLLPRLLVDEQALVSQLRDASIVALINPAAASKESLPKRNAGRWFSWRPLVAAAAGIVLGMFCTSLLFARAGLGGMKTVTLLEEGFDHATVSHDNSSPLAPGMWRGTSSETTDAQADVKPRSGGKMLRFLRADTAGKARQSGGHIADVYRLIDLREHRQELIDGDAIVQASACVNASAFPAEQRFGSAISIYALDAESVPQSASYLGTALESDANAMARSSRTKLDRDPAHWQELMTEMRLPANTEFIVVRLHINQLFDSDGSVVFTGSYADDVRVTLTRRAVLP